VQGASLVRNCLIRLSHMSGFYGDSESTINSSTVTENGQLGLSGSPRLTEDVEVSHNNALGFNPGWEAGGGKYAHADGVTISSSWFHDNWGNGFWFDAHDRNFVVQRSVFERNSMAGLAVELSSVGTIRQNVLRNNGSDIISAGDFGWYIYGVGLHVADSSSISVYENMSYDNQHGPISVVTLSDRDYNNDEHHPAGLVVRDNVFGFVNLPNDLIKWAPPPGNRDNSKAGFLCPVEYRTCTDDLAAARWENNQYFVPSAIEREGRWFMWGDVSLSFVGWQRSGRDDTGSLRVGKPTVTIRLNS